MIALARDLEATVREAADRLLDLSEEEAGLAPAPGKWSPKQIVGHLIDSASNNHGRFVRAILEDDMIFSGYAQVEWVACQHYETARWQDLVALWRSLNLHLAHFLAEVPAHVGHRPRSNHNFDEIAWKSPDGDAPTLQFFVADYTAHLKHHLGQIPTH